MPSVYLLYKAEFLNDIIHLEVHGMFCYMVLIILQ